MNPPEIQLVDPASQNCTNFPNCQPGMNPTFQPMNAPKIQLVEDSREGTALDATAFPEPDATQESSGAGAALVTNKNVDSGRSPTFSDGQNARSSFHFSLHHLNLAIAYCRPEVRQLVREGFLWCINHDVSVDEWALAIGMSEKSFYSFLTGRYVHPQTGVRLDLPEQTVQAMRCWLRAQKAALGHSIGEDEFILTPTAKRVAYACAIARESRTPVFLFGPSQVGKSWGLIHDAEAHDDGRTIYVRCSSISGLHGLMSVIGERIGVACSGDKNAMKQSMLSAFQPDMVLILDEFHELLYSYRRESFFACAEFVRELYDRAGMGIVLSLTNLGRDRIWESRRSDLEQIFRRGIHRIQVGTKGGLPLKEDLEMILKRHGLDFPSRSLACRVGDAEWKPRDILHQLAKDEGLKAICERLRYAEKSARQQGRDTFTWDDVMNVHAVICANAAAEEDWS